MKTVLTILLAVLLPGWAAAHTTIIFPQVDPHGEKNLLVAHLMPSTGGGVMGIRLHEKDTPSIKGLESFTLVHDGRYKDISALALPSTFSGRDGNGECYLIPLAATMATRAGDYVFVVRHLPHWKKNHGLYINKICKFFLNNGGLVTDWPHRILRDAPEIIPLAPPYCVYPGSLFRARAVDDRGENIANAEIHVEFLNYRTGDWGIDLSAPLLANREITNFVLFADNSGAFSFIPPRQGIWTFTLVDGDRNAEFNGRELRYDSSVTIAVEPLIQ